MKPKRPQEARIETILTLLKQATKNFTLPMSLLIKQEYAGDPYLILISCLLSLRSRDTQTYPIAQELFKTVRTPQEMLEIPIKQLEEIIKSIGFYHRKAHILKEVSLELLQRFKGKVPANRQDLLSIKGIGPKTANLVLGVAFNIPALCVDTHVHKLANRLGLVRTKTPEQTEKALCALIPQEYWIEINHYFVMWGQNICTPLLPKCSQCILLPLCPQIGVTKHR